MLFVIISAWIACGLYAAGTYFAYFQRKWPSIAIENAREDLASAVLFGITGPVGAFVGFFMSGFNRYGWSVRERHTGKG